VSAELFLDRANEPDANGRYIRAMQNEKLCSESEQSLAAVQNRQPDAHACNGYAAVYIRVSTDEQARGGISLDAQDELANAYCKTASLRTRRVIREEGISASKPLSEPRVVRNCSV
jgi:hypothetical protein